MVACFAFCHGDNGKGWSMSVLSATADSPRPSVKCAAGQKQLFKNSQPSQQGLDLEISPVVHI
jgi:hypothetical protein